jgi:hypothetical protein
MPDEIFSTTGALLASAPSQTVRAMPPGDFQALFSDAELSLIQLSTDPVVIRLRTVLQTQREDVRFDSERLLAGLNYLVAIGLLTSSRKTQILNGDTL